VPNEQALQSYFTQRIEKYLNAHGRRLVGWDEILEGGMAADATVMSWRGTDGAISAAAAGHDTVLSPWPTLYFDNRRAMVPRSRRGAGTSSRSRTCTVSIRCPRHWRVSARTSSACRRTCGPSTSARGSCGLHDFSPRGGGG